MKDLGNLKYIAFFIVIGSVLIKLYKDLYIKRMPVKEYFLSKKIPLIIGISIMILNILYGYYKIYSHKLMHQKENTSIVKKS